jgi:hypothetical protein
MLSSARKHVMGGVVPAVKPRRYGEAGEQRRVVAWLRARSEWLVMRIENAAKRSMAAAARDKAMGMLPGAPLPSS